MEERGVVKTSAIFISTRGKTVMYNTVEEVPPRLRKKLFNLNANAATVLIADRRGLKELLRARSEQLTETPGPAQTAKSKARRIIGFPLFASLRRLLRLLFRIRL